MLYYALIADSPGKTPVVSWVERTPTIDVADAIAEQVINLRLPAEAIAKARGTLK